MSSLNQEMGLMPMRTFQVIQCFPIDLSFELKFERGLV